MSDGSLISAIEKSNAEVVIIDSLHSVSGKLNPNQVKDMQYLSKLKQSVLEDGKTLVITHHISAHKRLDVESIMADRVGMHSMGSSFIMQLADAYYVLHSETGSNLETLYVRPVQKRISLNVKPFVARLIDRKSKMKFRYVEDYTKKPLDVEYEVDKDILFFLKGKKKSKSLNDIFYGLREKYGKHTTRNSLLRLIHAGKVDEIRTSPRKFTYRLRREDDVDEHR